MGKYECIVILMGVGIFVEFGLGIFCDEDGFWMKYDLNEVVMLEGFVCNFYMVYDFYNVWW